MASTLASHKPSNPADNAGLELISVTAVFTLLSLLVLLVRLHVRAQIIKNVGWDDIVMCGSVALNVINLGVTIVEVYYGLGRHEGDLTTAQITTSTKYNIVSQVICIVSLCLCKLSVGFALLRIAFHKAWKWCIIGFMTFVALYSTEGCFMVLAQCEDVRSLYDHSIMSQCWAPAVISGLAYFQFSMNIFSDLVFAVFIPLPMLWTLNVNARTRNVLFGILSLGLIGCVAGIVRISYLDKYGRSHDWLWDSRDLAIWTAVELSMGIIAGSLPAIRPLAKRFLGGLTTSAGSRGGGGKANTGGTPGSSARMGPGYYQSPASRGAKSGNWHPITSERRGRQSPTAHILGDTESSKELWIGPGSPKEASHFEMSGSVTVTTVEAEYDETAATEARSKAGVRWDDSMV